jgi:hypothetical protein
MPLYFEAWTLRAFLVRACAIFLFSLSVYSALRAEKLAKMIVVTVVLTLELSSEIYRELSSSLENIQTLPLLI